MRGCFDEFNRLDEGALSAVARNYDLSRGFLASAAGNLVDTTTSTDDGRLRDANPGMLSIPLPKRWSFI